MNEEWVLSIHYIRMDHLCLARFANKFRYDAYALAIRLLLAAYNALLT